MTTYLKLQSIWNGPGYRDLSLDLIDEHTKKEYRLNIPASEMQRLINACADAVKQIGTDGPLDWGQHPAQIYWPEVTPWKAEARRAG